MATPTCRFRLNPDLATTEDRACEHARNSPRHHQHHDDTTTTTSLEQVFSEQEPPRVQSLARYRCAPGLASSTKTNTDVPKSRPTMEYCQSDGLGTIRSTHGRVYSGARAKARCAPHLGRPPCCGCGPWQDARHTHQTDTTCAAYRRGIFAMCTCKRTPSHVCTEFPAGLKLVSRWHALCVLCGVSDILIPLSWVPFTAFSSSREK